MAARKESQRDPTEIDEYVERFGALLTEMGMNRMASRVFAALLTSDSGSLTAAELAERLRASPAAISGAIRYLEQLLLVTRRREPGSRRDLYVLRGGNDVWYEAILGWDRMTRWVDQLREGAEVLGPETPAGRRMVESADFFAYVAEQVTAMVTRWRKERHGLDDRGGETAADQSGRAR